MKENKKVWITPELITIVRNNPEEAVLDYCKLNGIIEPGAAGANFICDGAVLGCTEACTVVGSS